MNTLASLFAPSSIAVVGASDNVTKIRGRVLKLLIDISTSARTNMRYLRAAVPETE